MVENKGKGNASNKRYDVAKVDWLLIELVSLVNTARGLKFGITLNVRGATISGLIIGGEEYFEKFSEMFGKGWEGSDKPELASTIKEWFSRYKDIYSKEQERERETIAYPPHFIHIENAKIFSPGQRPIPSHDGNLWRGRISEVSGFSLGALSIEPPPKS